MRARALRGVTVVRGRRVGSVGAADGWINYSVFVSKLCVVFLLMCLNRVGYVIFE